MAIIIVYLYLLIFVGNKIDVPRAISEDELRQFFGLHGITTGKVCFFVYTCYKNYIKSCQW